MLAPEQAWQVLDSAEQVCSAAAVAQAVKRIAAEITRALADDYPLVLSVMGGAVVFTRQFLPLLVAISPFPNLVSLEFFVVWASSRRRVVQTMNEKLIPLLHHEKMATTLSQGSRPFLFNSNRLNHKLVFADREASLLRS